MKKLNEVTLTEQPVIAWLKEMGYDYEFGPTKKIRELNFILNAAPFLYRDAEHFLALSKRGYRSKRVIALKERGVYARMSVLLYHSTIEAILNYLLHYSCFPEISPTLKGRIERLPYEIKLIEITRHATKNYTSIEQAKIFLKLKELAELRNAHVHPKTLKYRGKFDSDSSKNRPVFHMEAKGQKLKHSKLEGHFLHIDYRDAKIAKEITDSFIKWLRSNLKNRYQFMSFMSFMSFSGDMPKLKSAKKIQIIVSGKGEDLFDMVVHKRFSKKFE